MNRATVKTISQLAGCHPQTVRKLADKGYLVCRLDYNGWRIFPNPQEAVSKIKNLLVGEEPKKASDQ